VKSNRLAMVNGDLIQTQWFQNEQQKPVEDRECLYLTGITLSSSDVNCLRKNKMIGAFAYCGQLDLTSYILE